MSFYSELNQVVAHFKNTPFSQIQADFNSPGIVATCKKEYSAYLAYLVLNNSTQFLRVPKNWIIRFKHELNTVYLFSHYPRYCGKKMNAQLLDDWSRAGQNYLINLTNNWQEIPSSGSSAFEKPAQDKYCENDLLTMIAERGALGNRVKIKIQDGKMRIEGQRRDLKALFDRILFEAGISQPKSLKETCFNRIKKQGIDSEQLLSLPIELRDMLVSEPKA